MIIACHIGLLNPNGLNHFVQNSDLCYRKLYQVRHPFLLLFRWPLSDIAEALKSYILRCTGILYLESLHISISISCSFLPLNTYKRLPLICHCWVPSNRCKLFWTFLKYIFVQLDSIPVHFIFLLTCSQRYNSLPTLYIQKGKLWSFLHCWLLPYRVPRSQLVNLHQLSMTLVH